MNPVKFTCILFGSGIYHQLHPTPIQRAAHWIILVLQQTVGVLDDNIVLKPDQLGDLFGNPFSKHRNVDFSQVHLNVSYIQSLRTAG
jgi:hypothetical protein